MSERKRDAAEAWLAENDPEYAKNKRSWQSPSTDALERDRSEPAEFKELQPIGKTGRGGYRKLPRNHNRHGGNINFEDLLRRRLKPE